MIRYPSNRSALPRPSPDFPSGPRHRPKRTRPYKPRNKPIRYQPPDIGKPANDNVPRPGILPPANDNFPPKPGSKLGKFWKRASRKAPLGLVAWSLWEIYQASQRGEYVLPPNTTLCCGTFQGVPDGLFGGTCASAAVFCGQVGSFVTPSTSHFNGGGVNLIRPEIQDPFGNVLLVGVVRRTSFAQPPYDWTEWEAPSDVPGVAFPPTPRPHPPWWPNVDPDVIPAPGIMPPPAPVPFEEIPHRPRTNPDKPPRHQPDHGPHPGTIPGTNPDPVPDPGPQPEPAPVPRQRPGAVPKPGTRPRPRPAPDPLPRVRPVSPGQGVELHPSPGPLPQVKPEPAPRPPGPREKERKFAWRRPNGGSWRIVEIGFEATEAIECLYGALPDSVRRRYRAVGAARKAQLVYRHFDQLNVPQALACIGIYEPIEDAAFGELGDLLRKANRKLPFGPGIGIGPAL